MKTLFSFVFVAYFATAGCSPRQDAPFSAQYPTQNKSGVILHGCRGYGGDWLENTNSFPVRIRQIRRSAQSGSEITESIHKLEAGSKLALGRYDFPKGFYIFTADGILIDFISSECPTK